jgi:hypothetical protein
MVERVSIAMVGMRAVAGMCSLRVCKDFSKRAYPPLIHDNPRP